MPMVTGVAWIAGGPLTAGMGINMADILLVGAAVTRPGALGAIFRSVDGGPFSPVRHLPTDSAFQSLTPHTTRQGVVYASGRHGVYLSEDAGLTWRPVPVPAGPGEECWAVGMRPDDPDRLLVGCGPIGVYVSRDAGVFWSRSRDSGPMSELTDIASGKFFQVSRVMRFAFDPTAPDLVFAACETNGLILSEDGGDSWRNVSGGLTDLARNNPALRSQINVADDAEGMLDGHAVCVSPAAPGRVFYVCRMGLFSSGDLGVSWQNHDVGRFAPFTYARDIRVDPQQPSTLYLALSISSRSHAGALYRSLDLGETWTRIDAAAPASSTIMSMGVDPLATGSAVYVTREGQVHWTRNGGGLWGAALLPPQAGDAYCAALIDG
jgi:photosystem II stability/assembly factor-like uncharacterized protein